MTQGGGYSDVQTLCGVAATHRCRPDAGGTAAVMAIAAAGPRGGSA
ncbi:MAG: hypothetical protein U0031_02110 [Thermomicrobiales bacterium]